MTRVLADANVLVSAALSRDPRAPSVLVLDAALDGRFDLITSAAVLAELASVLARPRLRRYLHEHGLPIVPPRDLVERLDL